MELNSLIQASYEAFQRHSRGGQAVLLAPASRYRSMLVAYLLAAAPKPVFYYAMGPDDVNVFSFLTGLTHDFANQRPIFGRHLNQIFFGGGVGDVDFGAVCDALVSDIAELSDEPFLLILDEYDRTDGADDIQALIEQVILRLPPHCEMVINSRTLPRLPWVSLIAQRRAIILRDEQPVTENFYGEPFVTGDIHLDVYALGPGRVVVNGSPIETWEGHLPRLLFFFALDRPVVTRSEICQAFWPELENDQAVNVFHVTKRRLHKALKFDVLVHEGGYYRINPEVSIYSDVMDFAGTLMRGRASEDEQERASLWQHAIELYKGPFLQGHNNGWITQRRREYQIGYLEALSEMASIYLGKDRPEHALGLLLRAVAENGLYEPVHRQIMQLYAKLGRRSEAAAHYQKLVALLKAEGRVPEVETQALYESIISS